MLSPLFDREKRAHCAPRVRRRDTTSCRTLIEEAREIRVCTTRIVGTRTGHGFGGSTPWSVVTGLGSVSLRECAR